MRVICCGVIGGFFELLEMEFVLGYGVIFESWCCIVVLFVGFVCFVC